MNLFIRHQGRKTNTYINRIMLFVTVTTSDIGMSLCHSSELHDN